MGKEDHAAFLRAITYERKEDKSQKLLSDVTDKFLARYSCLESKVVMRDGQKEYNLRELVGEIEKKNDFAMKNFHRMRQYASIYSRYGQGRAVEFSHRRRKKP